MQVYLQYQPNTKHTNHTYINVLQIQLSAHPTNSLCTPNNANWHPVYGN